MPRVPAYITLLALLAACSGDPETVLQSDLPQVPGMTPRDTIGLRQDGDRFRWDRQFNSAYLVGAGPPPYPRYDKVFLAPFGETMPYISNWDWLERALLSVGAAGMTFDLDRGGEPVRFDVPWQGGSVRVATPICFEDAFPALCRRFASLPDGAQSDD